MMSANINELAAALAKAQGQMQNAAKKSVNPHFKSKYADLAAVIDAICEPLWANGLSYTQIEAITENGLVLRTYLFHSSGQYIMGERPLPTNVPPQQYGSAMTYARRYSLSALCGIAQEDDDGKEAQKAKPTEIRTVEQPPKRENPNVTRWQDIYDKIDTTDITIDPAAPKLTVEKTRPEYGVLIKDMHRQTDVVSLIEWADLASPTVSRFPLKWQEFFRAAYQRYKDELDPPANGENILMAG